MTQNYIETSGVNADQMELENQKESVFSATLALGVSAVGAAVFLHRFINNPRDRFSLAVGVGMAAKGVHDILHLDQAWAKLNTIRERQQVDAPRR